MHGETMKKVTIISKTCVLFAPPCISIC